MAKKLRAKRSSKELREIIRRAIGTEQAAKPPPKKPAVKERPEEKEGAA